MVWHNGTGTAPHEMPDESPVPSTKGLVKLHVCLDDEHGWTQIESTVSKLAGLKHYPTPIFKHVAKPGRLLFRTQSVMLTLHCGDETEEDDETDDEETDHEFRSLNIHDRDGNTISGIYVDSKWAEKAVRDERRSHSQFKFVAVSGVSLPAHWTISDLDRYISGTDATIIDEVNDYLNSIKPLDPLHNNLGDGKDLHVMLIEPNEDAARRIGVANLRLVDWLKSDPKMEDIMLK
jgi:hypothetical protein